MATTIDETILSDLTSLTFRESWKEEGNELNLEYYISENFSIYRIKEELKNSKITYLLIELDGKSVGYCKLEREMQPEEFILERPLCIGRLYITKEFQNSGLGGKLLNEALNIAIHENFKVVWLGVWCKNEGAIRLYEKHGFRKFGNYKFIMGNEVTDDYLMKKNL